MVIIGLKTYRVRALVAASTLVLSLGLLPNASADGGGTFSLYDADQNGFLEPAEFSVFAATRRSLPADPEFWTFARVDTDGDNRVSEREMITALLEDVKRRQQTGR